MIVLLMLLGFVQAPKPAPKPVPTPTFFVSTLPVAELQNKQAVLETAEGAIVLDLLADAAPNHVAYFITQVRSGVLDGTSFHRVIRMGMVQGGDPITKDPSQQAKYGTGGLGVLRFEASSEKLTRGAVAAVLIPGRRDSAGSQFIILIADQPSLEGQFTVFARVADGLPVAQKISMAPASTTNVPTERIEIRKAYIRDKPAPEPEPFVNETPEELSKHRAVIETSMGNLTVELFADRAPTHVRSFLRMAASGVYDGTAFHRIAKGFVIQGGFLGSRREPLDERQQSFVRTMQPEFNPTPHDRGILSMAHGDDPASATSSFFIVLARNQGLDNQYTVFGRVVEGLDVIEKIEAVPVDGETPVTRIEVSRVRVEP
jgi:peptidyl-prolyl cis-trans isomerase B (cyclophilin B)